MSFPAEAQIAREIMKFAANGTLYRGSKPVMWSVVEKTALAEAEVEYEDHVSDSIYVAFPAKEVNRSRPVGWHPGNTVLQPSRRSEHYSKLVEKLVKDEVCIVIWTTTPWTIPANRAISFSGTIRYGLYVVGADASPDDWAQPAQKYIVADNLVADVFSVARV